IRIKLTLPRLRGLSGEPFFFWGAPKRAGCGSAMPGLCSRQGQTAPVHMHPTSQLKQMIPTSILALIHCVSLASWAGASGYPHSASSASARQEQPSTGKQAPGKETQAGMPALPRGKKLVLKDSKFQLVRDYQRVAEGGRYLSAERGEW